MMSKVIQNRKFFFFIILLTTFIIYIKINPYFALFAIDILFLFYILSSFNSIWKYLFLLHPIILFIIYQFYDNDLKFTELGDGNSYFEVIRSTLPYYSNNNWKDVYETTLLYSFKGVYIGVIPNILIPDMFWSISSNDTYANADVYFYWQSIFHVILTSFCIFFANKWNAFKNNELFTISIFAILSPSLLEFTVVPHRHFFTFFSLFLFLITFKALLLKISKSRLFIFFLSILFILVSKPVYLIPVTLFLIIFFYSNLKKYFFYIFIFTLVIIIMFQKLGLFEMINGYSELYSSGVTTFGSLNNIPILGQFFKLISAILAPFPWLKFKEHLPAYGGNELIFILHIMSSITGLMLIIKLIKYLKYNYKFKIRIGPTILFSILMSSTIFFGSSGFHGYLSIFFPFFAILFNIHYTKTLWAYPIFIAIVLEATYWIV
jgi:hypothetical protein